MQKCSCRRNADPIFLLNQKIRWRKEKRTELIKDKLVENAIAQILEQIYEPKFYNECFGFMIQHHDLADFYYLQKVIAFCLIGSYNIYNKRRKIEINHDKALKIECRFAKGRKRYGISNEAQAEFAEYFGYNRDMSGSF